MMLVVLVLGPTLPSAAQGRVPASLKGLDAYAAAAVERWEIPGLAIAVVKDDSIVFARGYGVRRLGTGAAVTPHTIFAIGSCTKAFTAAVLGMLVDSGKVAWDEPAASYLKGFMLSDPYVSRELTVRDLLTHRSGLMRGDGLWYATPYDRAEVLRRIRFLKPSWSFRSRYGYQNIMFLAAGEIVPAVTGTAWDEFVRARIFAPLGMTATTTSVTRLDSLGDVATPHERFDGRERAIAWRNIDNIGPAGSINSNVLDMAQWIRLQLGRGEVDGRRLLSAAVIKEMWSPQTIIPLDTVTERLRPSTHFQAYGLGWFLSDYRGQKLVSHLGAIDGFRAAVGLVPEQRLGVVVLTNGGEPGRALTTALFLRVVDAYLGGAVTDWSGAYRAVRDAGMARDSADRAKQERDRVNGTKPSLNLEAYVGNYRSEMYGDVTVAGESGALVIRFGPYFTGALSHWHFDTFKASWQDPEQGFDLLTFVLNADGRVDHLTWPGQGDFVKAPSTEP
ncbi:MAG TPA: serine hydrolase [Gemmatimonadales bacterium]|nr:serine hydrolase [Gemmatimonadales bacterium]